MSPSPSSFVSEQRTSNPSQQLKFNFLDTSQNPFDFTEEKP